MKSFDLQTNSLNQFLKEMYVDQSGEFVFGYGGFRTGYFTLIRYFEKGPLKPGYVACKAGTAEQGEKWEG